MRPARGLPAASSEQIQQFRGIQMYKKLTDQQPANHPQLKGLRMTRQRREVYDVLMSHRDHPTASEVYERAKIEYARDFFGDCL